MSFPCLHVLSPLFIFALNVESPIFDIKSFAIESSNLQEILGLTIQWNFCDQKGMLKNGIYLNFVYSQFNRLLSYTGIIIKCAGKLNLKILQ